MLTIAALTLLTVAATRLIAALLIVAFLIVTGTIATLLTGLVTALTLLAIAAIVIIVVTGTESALWGLTLQAGTEAFRTEAALVIVMSVVSRTFIPRLGALSSVYAWTR